MMPGYIPQTATLMIKPENSRGKLIRNSDIELTSEYFSTSILEIAGLRQNDSEISYFDIISGTPPPKRIFYDLSSWWQSWEESGASGTMVLHGIYEVSGDASDAVNWVYIKNVR